MSSVDQLLSWRRTTAHAATFYHPLMKQSLASRVCSNDYSLIYGTGHRDLFNALSTYLGANGDGSLAGGAHIPMMCALALLAFLLVISRDVNAAVRICAGVLALPRGKLIVLTLAEDSALSNRRLNNWVLYALAASFVHCSAAVCVCGAHSLERCTKWLKVVPTPCRPS